MNAKKYCAVVLAMAVFCVEARADGLRIAPAGSADPQPAAAAYTLSDDTLDNSYQQDIMLVEDNLLRAEGVSMSFDQASLNGYNGGDFYEKQTDDFSCIADGKIPVHRDQDGWNDRWRSRILIPDGSTLTWTWSGQKNLENVKIYTQWRDGWRNDVSVKKIEVQIGGIWFTLPNSTFCSARFSENNTVQPYLNSDNNDGTVHNRMVTFADTQGEYLARRITGLKITFGGQSDNIVYGSYWEIEAKGCETPDDECEVFAYEVVPSDNSAAASLRTYISGEASANVACTLTNSFNTAGVTFNATATSSGVTTQLTPLDWDSDYGYQLSVSRSGEALVGGLGGSFGTPAESVSLDPGALRAPGLLQWRLPGVMNTTDGITASDVPVARTKGPVMGAIGYTVYTDVAIANGYSDEVYYWATQKTVVYSGWIYLEAGTWYFLVAQDDQGQIKVDGSEIVRTTRFDEVSTKPCEISATGWHAIEIRCGNDGGNAGGRLEFGRSSDSLETMLNATYCCDPSVAGRNIIVERVTRDPSGTASVIEMDINLLGGYTLSAQYADEYGTWSEVPVANISGRYYSAAIPPASYFRVVAKDATDPTKGVASATKAQSGFSALDENPWVVFAGVGEIGHTSAEIPFAVISPGAGASSWGAKVEYGTTERSAGEGTAGREVDFVIDGLMPGAEYSAVLTVTNDLGSSWNSDSLEIETKTELVKAELDVSDTSVTLSGGTSLASGTALLKYGIPGEAQSQESVSISSDGAFEITVRNLSSETEYAYELEILDGSGELVGFKSGTFETISFESYGELDVSGGSVSADGGDVVVSFPASGRVRFEKPVAASVLLVGGGGGGGNGGYSGGGGGGAGGVIYRQNITIPAGDYQVVVGAGGVENVKGTDSSFANFIAYGGGAGNHGYGNPNTTDDGGSGGGASAVSDWAREAGTGMDGQGHDGGLNLHSAVLADDTLETKVVKNSNGQTINGGGGGGGAGAQGGSGSFVVKEYRDDNGTYTAFCDYYYAGNGGDGIACSITGEEVWYGGGGGGGLGGWYRNGSESSGGKGGGGKGGTYNDWAYDGDPTHGYKRDGEDGVDGTGGGGGGGGSNGNEASASNGGRGGDGIVIIRFAQQFSDISRPATGGNTIVRKRGYLIHTFTEDGEFDIPDSTYVDVLLVGGGGGGGNGYGAAGGGGAGGMLVLQHMTLLAGKYSVTVGAGGLGGIRDREDGENGGDSVFAGYIAVGGGGGAGIWNHEGRAGGSGGGAYSMTLMNNRGPYNGGSAVEGQGYPGGGNVLKGDNSDNFGAGGGGAGEAGSSATTSGPGKGGDGLMCDFSGEEKWYAGGGAGGTNANVGREVTQAKGGKGGGGDSGYWPTGVDPVDHYGPSDNMAYVGHAENGTGGGGGGGAIWGNGSDQGPGGNGGSGIVIIRYKHEPVSFGLFVR